MIAHRLATIKKADKIIVMDAGKIVEIGTHKKLLKTLGRVLKKAGYPIILTEMMDVATCSHQVGTLKFGTDPKDSVLDTFCRSHDIKNLFVMDGSFFPSSSAVNPALTIMAQALRVGDWMRETY